MFNRIIQYAKILIAYIIQLLFKIYWIIPVKKNRILLMSYEGKGFTCNPKYIFEYMSEKYAGCYEFIWVFKDVNNYKSLASADTKLVTFQSLKFFFYFTTSKIIITNASNMPYLPVRKNQCLINTWHGGGAYKRIDKQKYHDLPSYKKFITRNISYFISSNEKFTEIMSEGLHIDRYKFLNIGMPRNDIFFNNSAGLEDRLFKKLELPQRECKYILYAPTWRKNGKDTFLYSQIPSNQHNKSYFDLDFMRLIKVMECMYGGKWKILLRYHHLTGLANYVEFSDCLIDVSLHDDMQEIMYIASVLITDYSSSIWDFSFTGKPCFLYATDLEQYKNDQNFYFPIEKWPFPLARNNDELINNIKDFNLDQYLLDIHNHQVQLGSFETGSACEKISNKIVEICLE